MQAILQYINGKKTYIFGAATIAYGLLGMALGYVDQETGMQTVFLGLGMLGLRHALPTK